MDHTRASLFLGIALAVALFATPTPAIEFVGKVVGVTDGDTITVLVERRAIKVRLAEIDTPEKGQPYGSHAKQALSGLVFGKVATVREQTRDRYGRTVGRVYVGGRDVNAELVRAGDA
jgi:micrococcal nuclease